ncbi:MAG: CheR family methyltransferase [Bacteroidota bacterium]
MNTQSATWETNEYYRVQMTTAEFDQLSHFIYNELGIKMPDVKRIMLQSRLQKRLSELKMRSFKEYIEFVFSKEGRNDELITMIDLVTTNKTDFFRESSHFDFMTETALPEILSSRTATGPVKIWSAGCSSGEEPYTIAIAVEEYIRNNRRFDYEIFATDLSTRILERATTAVYSEDRIAGLSYDLKKRYFLKSRDPKNHTVRVAPEIRSRVSFQRLNFMDAQYPVDNNFDIVFCRNVLIYFDRDTQQDVITKLASRLKNDGFFFLGHSESITNMNVPLRQVKPTIFRRI